MPAQGRVTSVNLDPTGLEVVVRWDPNGPEQTIVFDADSLELVSVRMEAERVVAGHLAHLHQDGYVIGEPPPGANG